MSTSRLQTRLLAGAMALGLSLPLGAQVLMLDFGNNNPSNQVSSSNTSSPYHTATGSTADFTWNTIATSGSLSSLVWSNGTAATGVTTTGYKFNGNQTVTNGTGGRSHTTAPQAAR